MPFEPMDQDNRWQTHQCLSPEHNPPSHVVIQRPCKWVCPACGATTMIFPTTVTMAVGQDTSVHGYKEGATGPTLHCAQDQKLTHTTYVPELEVSTAVL